MNPPLPAVHLEAHRRRLTGLARHWLGNQAEAEDAVQDAYLRVQEALPSQVDNAVAWLTTALRHLCIDRLRRRELERRTAAEIAHVDAHGPSAEQEASSSQETRAALWHLADRLSADEAATLLLYAVFGFDHAEIGAMSGHVAATVRQRVHRSLRRLQDRGDADGTHTRGRAATEALFSLCWRALRTRNPSGLIAQLTSAGVACAGMAAGAARPIGRCSAAAGSNAMLIQIDGRPALAVMLDGVLLCTMPLGPLVSDEGAMAVA